MLIRAGYEIVYRFPQATPLILLVNVHQSRAADLMQTDHLVTEPFVNSSIYRDGHGNWCTRLVAPPGRMRLTGEAVVQDSGLPEPAFPEAHQHDVQDLPDEALVYLLPSRYCEVDQLLNVAWNLFGHTRPGWARVQAICDYVHEHVRFGYEHASPFKTAQQTYETGLGVCRDFAHLAVSFCRCMNIPARYCTAYLGDIGVPAVDAPMDFAGSFEAFIGGRWHSFDPRNNQRRIGRILIARGRDAADVAISTVFGPNTLESFKVWTDEVSEAAVEPQLAIAGGR
jgi:transglutaminase-like putative cysteine protease